MQGIKGGEDDKKDKLERILKEIINKVAQVILQSRIDVESHFSSNSTKPTTPRSSLTDNSALSSRESFGGASQTNSGMPSQRALNKRIQNKWFGLLLDDIEGIYQSLSFWRRNPFHPFFLDIFLSCSETSSSSSSSSSPSSSSSSSSPSPPCLLERWCLVHDPQSGATTQQTSNVYKRSIILIRFLYTYVRILPTYHKVVKICSSRPPLTDYFLTYQIYSTTPPPIDHLDRTNFVEYRFSPVPTQTGSLLLSVQYRKDLNFQLGRSQSGVVVINEYSRCVQIGRTPSSSSPGSYLTSPPDSFINTGMSYEMSSGHLSQPSSYDSRASFQVPITFPKDITPSPTFAPSSAPTSKGFFGHARYSSAPVQLPSNQGLSFPGAPRHDDEPPLYHPEPFFLEEDTSEEKELLRFLELCKSHTSLDFSVPSEPQTLSDVIHNLFSGSTLSFLL